MTEGVKKYRLLELQIQGWEELYTNLTKEECDVKIQECLDNAISPSRVKVERIA